MVDQPMLTDEQLRPFQCQECNTRYTRAEHLTRHFVSRHGREPPIGGTGRHGGAGSAGQDGAGGAGGQQGSQADGRWRPFVCPTCGKGFGRKDILKRHEKGHLKGSAEGDDRGEGPSSGGKKRGRGAARRAEQIVGGGQGGSAGVPGDEIEAAASVGVDALPQERNHLRSFGGTLQEVPTFSAPFPSVPSSGSRDAGSKADVSAFPALDPNLVDQGPSGHHPQQTFGGDPARQSYSYSATHRNEFPEAQATFRGVPSWQGDGRSPTGGTAPMAPMHHVDPMTAPNGIPTSAPHNHHEVGFSQQPQSSAGAMSIFEADGRPAKMRRTDAYASPDHVMYGPSPAGGSAEGSGGHYHPHHYVGHPAPPDPYPRFISTPFGSAAYAGGPSQSPDGRAMGGVVGGSPQRHNLATVAQFAPMQPLAFNSFSHVHPSAAVSTFHAGTRPMPPMDPNEDFYGWAASAFPPPNPALGFPLSIKVEGDGDRQSVSTLASPSTLPEVSLAPSNWMTIPDFNAPAPATALNAQMAAWPDNAAQIATLQAAPLALATKAGSNAGSTNGQQETTAIVESLLALSHNAQPTAGAEEGLPQLANGFEDEKGELPRSSWRPDPPRITVTQEARDRMQAEAQEFQRCSAFPDSRIDVPPRHALEQLIQDDVCNGRPEMPLHAPTFDPNTAPTFLVLAIASQGARDSKTISNPHVLAEALSELATRCLGSLYPSNHVTVATPEYQHAWLLIMYDAFSSGNRTQLKQSELMQSYLALGCRRLGRLVEPPPVNLTSEMDLDRAWKQWRDQEYVKRVGIMVIIHTGVGCMLWDFEPNTLFTETANCTLPCSDELWNAPSAEAWRKLFASRSSPPRAMNIREAMRTILAQQDPDHPHPLSRHLTLLQAKTLLFLLLLLTVDLQKRAAIEYVFFSSGRMSESTMKSRQSSEETLQRGYDFLEVWLEQIAYNAKVDRLYYCTMAGFFHMASIVGQRLPLGVLQSFVRWEPQTRRGLTETLRSWTTTEQGKLARRTSWHAGQIIGLHYEDPENPGFWYLENALTIFYGALSLYCYALFVTPPPGALPQENGYTPEDTLQPVRLDQLESRKLPHVAAWLDDGDGIPGLLGVPNLHAPGAPDQVLGVGATMLARFKVKGVAQMLHNVLKRFQEVGPHTTDSSILDMSPQSY